MLSTFRFRMEDPDGDVWDSSSVDEIYAIFTAAQEIAINLLLGAKQYDKLVEIQGTTSDTLVSGKFALPSTDYKHLISVQRNSDSAFIETKDSPPVKSSQSPMLQEDDKFEYAYYWNGYVYIQGGTNGVNYTAFYIDEPTVIDASFNPATSLYLQELTLLISQINGWIIDKQPDRVAPIEQQISRIYGVEFNAV